MLIKKYMCLLNTNNLHYQLCQLINNKTQKKETIVDCHELKEILNLYNKTCKTRINCHD